MCIPRLHLFELADQSWLPATIRDLVTDYLHFVETRFAPHQPTAALVAEALQRSDCTRIVDLCSGGGGSMPSLVHALAAQGIRPQLTLTDRFPNTQAFQRVAAASNVLPLVPLACWWDGIVSQLRAYSPAEPKGLAEAVGAPTYCWRSGRVPIASSPGYLTYLIGHPTVK